jgi:outer membrane protein OmpA-like peptidoglycan-associated protein
MMMDKLLIAATLLIFVSCNNQPAKPETTENKRIVMRFELDSAGNVSDSKVKTELAELAKRISANADRAVMYSYTEQADSAGKDIKLAMDRAVAAKAVMFEASRDRIYYSVGIEARGFENPIDAANPKSLQNRRIEIEFMK